MATRAPTSIRYAPTLFSTTSPSCPVRWTVSALFHEAAVWARALGQHHLQRLERVGFAEGLVPADAVDARKTHRHPGFVAGGTVHAVEGDFKDDAGRHLAHRPVAPNGIVAHPA